MPVSCNLASEGVGRLGADHEWSYMWKWKSLALWGGRVPRKVRKSSPSQVCVVR